MTDQLDSRTTRTVTAFMDETEHPIRRSTFTPVDGLALSGGTNEVEAVPEVEAALEVASAPEPAILLAPETAPEVEAPQASTEGSIPRPPERGSLDDEDLVPLVGRHTDDTATVDLIGILQAQMHLRATEAARFADWEAQILRIGTEEALDELERTRLHFTGVIPIQTSPTVMTVAAAPAPPVTAAHVGSAPAGSALVPERVLPSSVEAEVIPAGTAPQSPPTVETSPNVHVERARTADVQLLERADDPAPVAPLGHSTSRPGRILPTTLSILALAVVAAALFVWPFGASTTLTAVFASVGVIAAAWVGYVAARLALGRGRVGTPVATRPAPALAPGLVLGTAVGWGLVRTTSDAFAWQGYLLTLVQVHGFDVETSVAAGLVAAAVVSFVVVLLARVRATAAATEQGRSTEQDPSAD